MNRKLVWTRALLPDYRPADLGADVPFVFTAIIAIEPRGNGTKYTATVMPSNEGGKTKHEEMGFYQGGARRSRTTTTLRDAVSLA